MNHPVVLTQHMHPASRLADATQLRQHPLRLRHRLSHVPAHHEVELSVGEFQLERIALLEPHPRRKRCISSPRISDRALQDVDAHQLGVRVARREPRGDFPAAAADIRNPGVRRQPVALEEMLFLRPDRHGLRSKIAQHRLVGHLLGLGISLFHGSVRCNLSGRVSVPKGRTSRQRGISMSVRFVSTTSFLPARWAFVSLPFPAPHRRPRSGSTGPSASHPAAG